MIGNLVINLHFIFFSLSYAEYFFFGFDKQVKLCLNNYSCLYL